jgi:hypothetical protein
MPDSNDPADRSRDYLTPASMLELIAAAMRGGGPASVLATCDAVEYGHLTVAQALLKLRQMARR